jgi:hypothetical protein
MGAYLGFVNLGSTLAGSFLTRNGNSPQNADAAPTYRAYGASGVMANGTGSATLKDTGSATGASNASPVVITSSGHGLSTGTRVTISGVLGNTAANGTFTVTRVDANTFSLDGSTGNGAYSSGGSWSVAGLYAFGLDCTQGNGYEAGKTYTVLVTATVSSAVTADDLTFTVV